MDFLNKLFSLTDAKSPAGKIITVIGALFLVFVFLWLFTSAMGLWNNEVSQAAHVTGGFSKFLGWVFLGLSVFWAWWNWSDRITFRINETAATVILFLLLILSLLFFTGWYANVY
jgi:hypothetical protein